MQTRVITRSHNVARYVVKRSRPDGDSIAGSAVYVDATSPTEAWAIADGATYRQWLRTDNDLVVTRWGDGWERYADTDGYVYVYVRNDTDRQTRDGATIGDLFEIA